MGQSFGHQAISTISLSCIPYGHEWKPSSEIEANGHWKKSVKKTESMTSTTHSSLATTKASPLNQHCLRSINEDIIHKYSLPIPFLSVILIPGLVTAPMIIMAQNTINDIGKIIPKDQLAHDQSWQLSSGRSVTSRMKKNLLIMPFWFLHPLDCQLGSRHEGSLPRQAHPCNKNQLQVSLPERASSLVNSP
jgi:hypothetical protein